MPKKWGVVIAKEKKFLFEVFSTSGYFWHSIRMHKYAKYLKIIPFLKSSVMYIYVLKPKKWEVVIAKEKNSSLKFPR